MPRVNSLGTAMQGQPTRCAVAKLPERVKIRATVLRDGQPVQVAAADVVPGDVVVLSTGSTVPGDCLVVESKDLYAVQLVTEALPDRA